MKIVAALLASAIAAAAPAPAAPPVDTVDTSVTTQLPRTAVPRHYAIDITTHAAKLAFGGTVAIDIDVVAPANSLTLNAADLTISAARLTRSGNAPLAAAVTTDTAAQTATFTFDRQLTPGPYRLTIDYAGKINTQATGLFALDYKDKAGKDARALYTQFEAPDARRFVPSWDEPDYKATFDLSVNVPADHMAVSNMPAASSRALPNGLKKVSFQRTPVMSTYLLFLAAGDFERVTKRVGDKEVGIVMTRGNADKAGFALDAEAQLLPYFDDYFGTPYPLPKLDNVAGPGQSQFFGAMENWGAIFTFEYALLNDSAITTEAQRQSIFSIEAHEMAHQWFGDLVTMAWWDDLWLNEGFASWMENKATRHFHPDWQADIDRIGSREAAMALDSLNSTHPVVQQVRTVEQANQAFDAISYNKGEAVISMLEDFAGEDVWRAGIQRYMKTHAYRNTRTRDLWTAVEAAGAAGLTAIAGDFTTQPGIPLIAVGQSRCVNGSTVATLTQAQFSADKRAEVAARPLAWRVPVKASAGGAATQVVTSGPTTTLTVPSCGTLLVNAGQTGYFRTLYAPADVRALQAAVPALAPVDQYGLLSDQLALSTVGYQPMAAALGVLAAVPADATAKVTAGAVLAWDDLHDLMDGDTAAQAAIAARAQRLYAPRLRQLGFVPRPGEPAVDAVLRETLIASLGRYRDPATMAESQRLFAAWQADADAIPGSLKATWLRTIAVNADAATWDTIRAKARATTGTVERATLYRLLGSTRDEALARRALDVAISDEPGKTVSSAMIAAVATRHPRLAVDFVIAHLDQINQLIDVAGRSSFMQRLVESSRDAALIPVLERYAAANLAESDRQSVQQSIDRIRVESAQGSRIRTETAAWLRANPL
ncbi:M1 family metallopeptidase [Sphingomonas sabuli]|uniref:M1 family metallopeptidase n=1 Tax=Sphingomonas sabuli TaxID=2764186 RepID=UPI001FEAAB83|nr:M1 family metallopeptidase [Sphingomonas sabuli]